MIIEECETWAVMQDSAWSGRTRKSVTASLADDLLHLVEISLQGFASSGRDPVFRTRNPSFEALGTDHVVRVLKLAGVDAQITVGSLKQALQLRKCKCVTHSKSADDAQAHALVNDGIEL